MESLFIMNIRNEHEYTVVRSMDHRVRIVFGIIILTLPLLCLSLYLPVLLILLVDKEFRKVSAYIIMTHVGVLDALQLMVHSYSGMLVIADVAVDSYINKIVGALLTGLWFSWLAFTLLLTVNRLIIILLQRWFPFLSSPIFTYSQFAVCYLCFIVPFILKLMPDCNYIFNPDTFSWSYLPSDSPISFVMITIGNYLVLLIVVLSIATYVSIFSYITFFSNAKMSTREYRITYQVSLVILYFLFSFVYWTYLMPIFGRSAVSDFFSCLVWVVMNGIHPVIYIVFNQRLRYSFFTLLTQRRLPRETVTPNRTVIQMKSDRS